MAEEHPGGFSPGLTNPAEPASIPADDDLPQFEELTPELMEDECLRGDAVLRGALLLLALLLGWTLVTESPLLVQIRSGEYMLSHGLLPPRQDVFSASAEGRRWINLSWLSDLVLAGGYRLAGMRGLSVLSALLVAGAFFCLGRVTVPRVSTWWSSCCGLLALIAVFPMFQPGPSTWTLLGFSILLLLLSRESELPADAEIRNQRNLLKWTFPEVPILFLFWANLDSRAWMGLLTLLLFVGGDALTRRRRGQPQSRRDWGVVLITLLVMALLSPWPFQQVPEVFRWWQICSAMQTYGIGSELFPHLANGMRSAEFWKGLNLYSGSALLLLGISLGTLVLNFRRANLGWWGTWLGINLLSLVDGNCVCYAAVVNAAVATLQGQFWYSGRFSQAYGIDSWSVAWGRGGRAVMVFLYFLIAYLGINGALMGPQGRRLGWGLDPRWTARLESLQDEVVVHSYTSRIFPTTAALGDALIWTGKKPFLDSRVGLYLSGPKNLLALHQQIRAALFAAKVPADPADAEIWKSALLDFKTYDVLVRLWGPLPPYEPMMRMLTNTSWRMTGLGAAGANFTRSDLQVETLQAHLQENSAMRFSQRAFRPATPPRVIDLPMAWPVAASNYDRWLIQKLEVTPNAAELAAHYEMLISLLNVGLPLDQAGGLAMLAIRQAREALAVQPNQAAPYRVLSQGTRVLQQVEQQISAAAGANSGGSDDVPSMAAAFAAVIASGGNPVDLQRLLEIQLQHQQLDLSLRTLTDFQERVALLPAKAISPERQEELRKLQEDLKKGVAELTAQIEKAKGQGASREQLVAMALRGGCPGLALTMLREDLTQIERSPELKLLYSVVLMQNGEYETALQSLEQLEPMMTAADAPPQLQPIASQWRNLTADANQATNNLQRAIELWGSEGNLFLRSAVQSLLQMPFGAMGLPIQYELWPAYFARMGARAAIELPERMGQLELRAARAELQLGELKPATQRLQQLLKQYPQCSQRFVAAFYLSLLTNQNVEVAPMPPQEKPTAPAETKPADTQTDSPPPAAEAATPSKPTAEDQETKPETDAESSTPGKAAPEASTQTPPADPNPSTNPEGDASAN